MVEVCHTERRSCKCPVVHGRADEYRTFYPINSTDNLAGKIRDSTADARPRNKRQKHGEKQAVNVQRGYGRYKDIGFTDAEYVLKVQGFADEIVRGFRPELWCTGRTPRI